jgi:protoporphyrinogen oxidase
METYRRLFLGAGLTGLSCAYHLGGDYLLVEKEDEPGGIVRTRKRPGGFLCDGTGHWLHLRNDYMFMELCEIPFAYVIFDQNYERCRQFILEVLAQQGVLTAGRWGGAGVTAEWKMPCWTARLRRRS